ncbi:MAG TPA: response regulator transcription factor [Streptosporangiaceae bacterium]
MSSVMERPFEEGRAAQLSAFRVAILVRSEIMRQGLTAMLRSLSMVDGVDVWAWPALSRPQAGPDRRPDVLILGCDGAELSVIDGLARDAAGRGAKVLLLLDQVPEELLDAIAMIPVNGFLVQHDLNSDSLAEILTVIADGGTAVPPAMAQRLLTRARTGGFGAAPPNPKLTPREKDVLALLVAGLSNKQIARRLNISQHGVKRLVSNVLAKLGCPNRTQAVALAITARILSD